MKKILCSLLFVLLLFTVMGCSKTSSEPLDINALGQYVINNVEFDEHLEELDKTACLNLYGISVDCECCAYTSGSRPERFAAFQTANSDDLAAVKESIEAYIDYLDKGYSSYGPDQLPKIRSAVLIEKTNCLIFCISADNSAANKIISDYIG